MIPKTEHTYGDWTVTTAATCTEDGSREKKCAVCGDKITETIHAAGHKWNTQYTVEKAATYTAEGSESIHCSVCGAVKDGSRRVIPKLLKPVSLLTISGITAKTYNGKAQTQELVVNDGTATLKNGTDYTVSLFVNTPSFTSTVAVSYTHLTLPTKA